MSKKLDIVYNFGKDVIVKSRDMTIQENFEIVDGKSRAPSDIALYDEIHDLNIKQRNTIKKIIINCIDGAINNFIWMMEQNNDKYAFIAKNEENSFDLEQESDGLCVGQYEFIEQYSKYNNILDILETGKIEKEPIDK